MTDTSGEAASKLSMRLTAAEIMRLAHIGADHELGAACMGGPMVVSALRGSGKTWDEIRAHFGEMLHDEVKKAKVMIALDFMEYEEKHRGG